MKKTIQTAVVEMPINRETIYFHINSGAGDVIEAVTVRAIYAGESDIYSVDAFGHDGDYTGVKTVYGHNLFPSYVNALMELGNRDRINQELREVAGPTLQELIRLMYANLNCDDDVITTKIEAGMAQFGFLTKGK